MALYEMQRKHGLLNCQIKVILQCLLPDDLSDSWISSKKRNSQMCTIVYFYHVVK